MASKRGGTFGRARAGRGGPARRRATTGATAALSLLALALPGAAQTPLPEATGAIALPQIDVNAAPSGGDAAPSASRYLAPSTTSATRTDTPLRDVPQSVTVTTRETIRDLSMQSLQDVLRWVPGAGYAQGEGNRDTPVLRGQSTTASLFQDGLRDDVQYFRDLYNLERVEVLLGPNAMVFGRGGAGGVINRVTRAPSWDGSVREVRLQAGSFGNRRATLDLNEALGERAALRLMGLYEESGSYRDGVNIRRSGINPQVAFRLGEATTLRLSYENFRDDRTADRGVPSFRGRPLATGTSTFFGDPLRSPSRAEVNSFNLFAEHRFANGVVLRNALRYADYDKFYQNVYPGAVSPDGRSVALAAYSNATQRRNLLNQTDLLWTARTGPVEHRLLAGVELSRQETENRRLTGHFASLGANATSVSVPLGSPRTGLPIAFRQSATDADNSGVATGAALYVQDQMQLLPRLQAILGLRFEHFNVEFANRRTGGEIRQTDNTVSPRAGLVWRPLDPLSLYASYSQSYLPRAGEQLASLTLTNRSLSPERFTNYEVGAKWEVTPALALTAALYRLDRTNVAVADPNDATRLILVDGTRTRGFELGFRGAVTERWSVLGGWALQEGELTSGESTAAPKGNRIPFLPRNTLSLWNRVQVLPAVGLGLGVVHQSSYFAATDNAVRIPSFTRFDAAAFWDITPRLTVQANFENLANAKYYPVANSNNNITPGSPFAARVALTARF